MKVIDLGLCDYQKAYQKQMGFVEDRFSDREKEDLLVFVEHPEVYTFGRKYKDEVPNSLVNTAVVERGGDATYHNPGQLVCYPIIKLEESKRDLNLFLRYLEDQIIDVLADFGIKSEAREKKTGVWIQGKEKKIASIGVAIKQWVSYHGFALNVCNELSGFSKITPCGFNFEVMTSMQEELKRPVDIEAVKAAFINAF